MNTKIKHLITWKDWSHEDMQEILQLAFNIKNDRVHYEEYLKNRTLVMLFQKTSTRTRVSFETAMTELGGHAIFLDWNTSNFQLSKIKYETAYLSRNAALIMARMKKHEELLELRDGSIVPIINGCDDRYHPCQAMADMLTILEDRGKTEGARLSYFGVHNNVVNSLMAACAAFGVHLTLVCPIAPKKAVDQELKDALAAKGLLTETLDKQAAAINADYVYTDTWVDMEFFDNPEFESFKEERINTMMPYQLNKELLKDSSAKVMHDMPIHPGFEISEELVESDGSLLFTQAENRLYAQKAIMIKLMS